MSHLTSEQVSDYWSSAAGRSVEAHIAECRECRAEVLRLKRAIDGFRDAIDDWAANPEPVRASGTRPVWAAAAMAAVLAMSVLLGLPAPAGRGMRNVASDAALLNQIDSGVARTVPAPMEPLSRLVSWETQQ